MEGLPVGIAEDTGPGSDRQQRLDGAREVRALAAAEGMAGTGPLGIRTGSSGNRRRAGRCRNGSLRRGQTRNRWKTGRAVAAIGTLCDFDPQSDGVLLMLMIVQGPRRPSPSVLSTGRSPRSAAGRGPHRAAGRRPSLSSERSGSPQNRADPGLRAAWFRAAGLRPSRSRTFRNAACPGRRRARRFGRERLPKGSLRSGSM